MAQQVFPPNIIIKVIREAFFKYRDLTPTARVPGAELPIFNDDRIISDMEQFSYVRLDAIRNNPKGKRDWVIVLILGGSKKKYYHSNEFRTLLNGIESEKLSKDQRLDELIIVAEDIFFAKKNLIEVVREMQIKMGTVACNAYPYCNFACVIPEHKSVPKHRIMSQIEMEEFLHRERLLRSDLPIILTTDPAIVWLGAREGQVVEIVRDSYTTGTSINYRRVERGSL